MGLDIDGTITTDAARFSRFAELVLSAGGEVHVVSSRSSRAQAETQAELKGYRLRYSTLFLLPELSESQLLCPHGDLDWYQKHQWLKVDYALRASITHFVDDDLKVIALFKRFAPTICAMHPQDEELRMLVASSTKEIRI